MIAEEVGRSHVVHAAAEHIQDGKFKVVLQEIDTVVYLTACYLRSR